MPLTEATADIAATLARHLPAGRVADVPDPYREEPRGRWRGTSATLVRPRTTEEVAEIVRFARAERVGIVPYAGGTGLVGGQTGQGAATILLSVERMDAIEQVDPDGNVAVAGAGAILADVQKAAAAAGRLFPLSLASEGSARIGGLLATNAGGTGVLRHGNARDLCLGVEAVLADGSVLKGPGRLRKDNTGYDLRHLLIGSEGTLGIITRAALRLVPQPGEEATALLSVPGPAAALALLGGLRRALGDELSAFELMARMGFDFLAEAGPETQVPLSPVPDWVVLVEAGAPAGARLAERVEAALGDALEAGTITDALIAQNRAQAAAFWELRERLPEGNRRVGAVASHDISVPIAAVPAFIAEAGAAVAAVDGGCASTASATWATAICTTTCSRPRAATGRRMTATAHGSAARCTIWWPRMAARSAPSTASAAPSPPSWRAMATR